MFYGELCTGRIYALEKKAFLMVGCAKISIELCTKQNVVLYGGLCTIEKRRNNMEGCACSGENHKRYGGVVHKTFPPRTMNNEQ